MDASFGGRLSSQEVERHRAQDGHLLCTRVVAKATRGFANADIKHPVERMFHPPVGPDRLSDTLDFTGKRGQDLAWLDRDRPLSFDVRLDPTDPGHLPP